METLYSPQIPADRFKYAILRLVTVCVCVCARVCMHVCFSVRLCVLQRVHVSVMCVHGCVSVDCVCLYACICSIAAHRSSVLLYVIFGIFSAVANVTFFFMLDFQIRRKRFYF